MRKRYPFLGIAGVLIAYSSIVTAIAVSPWFSWFNNALSDLGNTSNPANIHSGASLIFDSGLIISGVLAALFTFCLSKAERFSWKYVVWTVPLLISSIDLAMIGVFNESLGGIHLVVSVIFFFFTTLALLLYGYVSFPLGTPKTGAVALTLGVLCAVMWVTRWPWQGVAIQETVTSLTCSSFVMIVAVRMLTIPKESVMIRSSSESREQI